MVCYVDQYGFRRDRSTKHCIAQLALLLEARVMQGATAAERRTFVAFLDVKAAFPSIWRELTFVELFALGIRGGSCLNMCTAAPCSMA